MEHWPLARRPYGSERVLSKIPSATGEEEALRTAQLEVRDNPKPGPHGMAFYYVQNPKPV